MIKIQKGDAIKTVTNGAFENLYKKMGFKKVNEQRDKFNIKEAKVISENEKPAREDKVKSSK